MAIANAGGAVYGAIMIGVLFAAEDSSGVGYPATVAAATTVVALYWLTNLYAHSLGSRLESRERLHPRLLWRSCVHELPTVEGALLPIAVLLVTWAAGISITGGVTAALASAVAMIVVLEVAAGWRSRQRARDLLLHIAASGSIGVLLVGLKLTLH